MIFTAALLTSLLGTTAATVATTTVTTATQTSTHEVKIAELKKQLREKLAVPTSMSAKIAKFSKLNLKESSIDLKTTTFDESQTNLRGLKMKDNFLSFMGYMDDQCMTPQFQFGNLVNYCFNEQSSETGAKRSTITKVNLKENLAVEIQYEGYNCKGIPSKVINMFYEAPAFNGWGSCFPVDGMYYRVEYLNTYPMTNMPGMYLERIYPEGMCTADNMNSIEFMQYTLEMMGIPLNMCVPVESFYVKYSTASCASDGVLTVEVYADAACTSVISSDTVWGDDCAPAADDDGDDDDTYDDDAYNLVGVVQSTMCT